MKGELRIMNQMGAFAFFLERYLNDSSDGPRLDLQAFATFAAYYDIPVPTVPKVEPVQDPNLPYVEGICYTLGDGYKQHLYSDCRHLKDKQWSPCVCDPNEICLTCVARKASEESEQ